MEVKKVKFEKIYVNQIKIENEKSLWENYTRYPKELLIEMMKSKQYFETMRLIEQGYGKWEINDYFVKKFPNEETINHMAIEFFYTETITICEIEEGHYVIQCGNHRLSLAKELGYDYVLGIVEELEKK